MRRLAGSVRAGWLLKAHHMRSPASVARHCALEDPGQMLSVDRAQTMQYTGLATEPSVRRQPCAIRFLVLERDFGREKNSSVLQWKSWQQKWSGSTFVRWNAGQ